MKPRQRPELPRDPTYNLPSAETFRDIATPLEKALSALKVGAILAAVVTITMIYVGTYGGVKGRQELVSMAVLGALIMPSLIAYVLAWRSRLRRRRGAAEDPPSGQP